MNTSLRPLLLLWVLLIPLLWARPCQAYHSASINIATKAYKIRNAHVTSGSFKQGYGVEDYNQKGQILILTSSFLRGITGSFELWSGNDLVGTVHFDSPFIGAAECRMDWGSNWSGQFTWDTTDEMAINVGAAWRNTRPTIRVPIPAVGTGVVRGKLSWDRSNLSPQPGLTYAQAAQRLLLLQVQTPRNFLVLDPYLQPKTLYQGQLGEYEGRQLVGKLRWLSSTDDEAEFELYDLPTDLPLWFQYRRQVPSKTVFLPGSASAKPDPLSLVPPGKGDSQFVVELESSSRFVGPLPAANPRFDHYDIALFGAWQSESGDGSGATSLDPAFERLRQAALSRINPNPLLRPPSAASTPIPCCGDRFSSSIKSTKPTPWVRRQAPSSRKERSDDPV